MLASDGEFRRESAAENPVGDEPIGALMTKGEGESIRPLRFPLRMRDEKFERKG